MPEPSAEWHVAVNGQATMVQASPETPLAAILTDAILQTGNERWGGEDRWECRDPQGVLLDGSTRLGDLNPETRSRSGCWLFVQLKPGEAA